MCTKLILIISLFSMIACSAQRDPSSTKNVFVTDGACMTSSACQNPSLTYMALTARAADYAASELKKKGICDNKLPGL